MIITLNIVATAIVRTSGWLVGRFGQRRLLLWSITGFTITTLACAFANSLELLPFIGGALLGTRCAAFASDRGRHLPTGRTRQGAVMRQRIGPAIGPLRVISAEAYWRWVFLLDPPHGFADRRLAVYP